MVFFLIPCDVLSFSFPSLSLCLNGKGKQNEIMKKKKKIKHQSLLSCFQRNQSPFLDMRCPRVGIIFLSLCLQGQRSFNKPLYGIIVFLKILLGAPEPPWDFCRTAHGQCQEWISALWGRQFFCQ